MQNRTKFIFTPQTDFYQHFFPYYELSSETRPVGGTDRLTVLNQSGGDFHSPTPQKFTKLYIMNYEGRLFQQTNVDCDTLSGGNVSPLGVSPSFSTNFTTVYNEALSKIYDQLRGGLDLSVSTFEAKQVGKMAKGMVGCYNLLQRLNPKNLGKQWLETQYGLRPLMGDIYGTLDEVISRRAQGTVRLQAKAHQRDSSSNVFKDTWFPGSTETITGYGNIRCNIIADFEMKESHVNELSRYTSLNPASIAWELTPYSFVADWAFDIGSYARNLETSMLAGQQLRSAMVTFGFKNSIHGLLDGSGSAGAIKFINGNARAQRFDSYKERIVVGLLVPRPPAVDLKMGWQRLISAAALLSNFFDTHPKNGSPPGRRPPRQYSGPYRGMRP